MKTKLVTLLALTLTLGVINAADEIPVVAPQGDTPTFSLEAGGFVKTTDFDNAKSGTFVGFSGYPKPLAENLGLFGEARFYNRSGTAVDEAFGGLLFAVHEGDNATLAIYGGAGADFQEGLDSTDRNDILIGAGLRWDAQLWSLPLYAGVKAGWEKKLDQDADHQAIGAAFLSYRF